MIQRLFYTCVCSSGISCSLHSDFTCMKNDSFCFLKRLEAEQEIFFGVVFK